MPLARSGIGAISAVELGKKKGANEGQQKKSAAEGSHTAQTATCSAKFLFEDTLQRKIKNEAGGLLRLLAAVAPFCDAVPECTARVK